MHARGRIRVRVRVHVRVACLFRPLRPGLTNSMHARVRVQCLLFVNCLSSGSSTSLG